MKNNMHTTTRASKLLMSTTLLLLSLAIYGQTDTLQFIYHYDSSNVKIRWIPADYEIWKAGNDNGYSIRRLTVIDQGDTLARALIDQTIVNIDTILQPLTEAQWDSDFPTNDYAKIAKGAIYYMDTLSGGPPSLSDAIDQQQSRTDRYQFGMVASFLDFDVAKGMALGIEDSTVVDSSLYIYQVTINGGPTEYLTVSTTEATSYPAVTEVTTEQQGESVVVSWSTIGVSEDYVAYHIERQDPGSQTFTQINALPYVLFYPTDAEDVLTGSYIDSTVVGGQTYQYRVVGISPMGESGTPSQPSSISVEASSLPIQVLIDGSFTPAKTVDLVWAILGDVDTSAVVGYNVLRKMSQDSSYTQINTNLLTTRSYSDSAPLSTGYYLIEAIDTSGRSHYSLSKLIVGEDMTPPAIPQNLSARIATKTTIEFTWDPVSAPDLAGYRIYSNDVRDTLYFAINPRVIEDTIYTYTIPRDMIHEELCYKITALDRRGNESAMSACEMVDFPDSTPPSAPIITKVEATNAGVAIGWRFSSSADRAYHYVERKWSDFPDWEKIITIPRADEANYLGDTSLGEFITTSYVDTTIEERVWHDYRLIAVDSSGNMSSTKVFSVYPRVMDSIVGEITAFAVRRDSLVPASLPQADEYNRINYVISQLQGGATVQYDTLQTLVYLSIMTEDELDSVRVAPSASALTVLTTIRDGYWDTFIPRVALSWQYSSMVQLQYFEIYRSTSGANYVLYDTALPSATGQQYTYLDERVSDERFYLYKIRAVHQGARYSDMSPTLYIKIDPNN